VATETSFKTVQVGNNHSTLIGSTPQDIPIAVLKVKTVLEKCKKFDDFNDCFFDLSEIPNFTDKQEQKALKALLPVLIEEQKGKHVIGLKLLPCHARIVNYAIQYGFSFHNANHDGMFLTLCLKGHNATNCNFPKFMTVSVGVTGVVFDKELQKVLLIQEKWGKLNNMKPPTGSVDYLEAAEHPLNAVVREIKEETNIEVKPSDAVLVGNAWTQHLRGNNPDINFVFAFRVSTDAVLKAQEDEITHVGWQSIETYIKEDSGENNQPYVMKRIVTAALQAFVHQKEWVSHNLYWNNGKPVTLFCFNYTH